MPRSALPFQNLAGADGDEYFELDPAYDGFRKDPRFAELLRHIRLQ